MRTDIDYPLAKELCIHYNKINKQKIFSILGSLYNDFSEIHSIEKLEKFCSKLGINKEELHKKNIPCSSNYVANDVHLSFIGLAFLARNDFMVDYFKHFYKDIYQYPAYITGHKYFIDSEPSGEEDDVVIQAGFEDLITKRPPGIFSQIITEQNIGLSIFNAYHRDLSKNQKLIETLIKNFVSEGMNYHNTDYPVFIEFISLFKQGAIIPSEPVKQEILNSLLLFIKTEKTFELLIDTFDVDLINNPFFMFSTTDNFNLTKILVKKAGIRKCAQIYEQLHFNNSEKETPLCETLFMANCEKFIFDAHYREFNHLHHVGLEWITFLHEQNELTHILKERPDYLIKALDSCEEPDHHIYDIEAILPKNHLYHLLNSLEKEYDFKYQGYYEEPVNKDAPSVFRTKRLITQYLINNNLNDMTYSKLKPLLMHLAYNEEYDLINKTFDNLKNSRYKKDLYIVTLQNLKSYKSIKSQKRQNRLYTFFTSMLNEDFIQKHNISVDKKEIIKSIEPLVSKRSNSEFNAFLSQYILKHSINIEPRQTNKPERL